MTIRYTPEARRDIIVAQRYIRENFFNEDAAEKLGHIITKTISLLKEQPNMGLPLSEKTGQKTDLLYLVIQKKYIAFYKILGKQISIIRILDTRTNYMQELFG